MFRSSLASLLLALVPAAAPHAETSQDEPVAIVRGAIEPAFRAQTGIGFREFQCRLPKDVEMQGTSEFTCEAVDEEGDRFLYRLWRNAEHPEGTVSAWQPLEQVPEQLRARLTGTVERFLDAFAAQDWDSAAALRHASLAATQSDAALAASLSALRERVGEIGAREPLLYSQPDAALFALEYRVESAQGPLVARFQLRQEQEAAQLTGYLITPETGSPLAARMLQEQAVLELSPLLGSPVSGLRFDPQSLLQAGDAAIGEVLLKDGPPVAVLISRTGTAFDFIQNDFRFSILDVPWMVARHEVESGRPDSEVRCPGRMAPDGGSLDCVVSRRDGKRVVYRVQRQGGEHRMTEVPREALGR